MMVGRGSSAAVGGPARHIPVMLSEVVGNLDCWGAQFLLPKKAANQYKEIVNIDLDEAWRKLATNTIVNGITALTLRDMSVMGEPGMAEPRACVPPRHLRRCSSGRGSAGGAS